MDDGYNNADHNRDDGDALLIEDDGANNRPIGNMVQLGPPEKRCTKKYFMELLDTQLGYYLPSYRAFNADFAQKVLNGSKKLLKKSDVNYLGKL